MNAVPFDTLKMAQRLEAAGFSGSQAAGAAEALAEAVVGTNLATRDDLTALEGRLAGGIAASEAKIASTVATSETKLWNAIELLRRDMTIKLGGMLIVAVGVLLAAIRYLPPHP